jgi:hypothetical protein
MAAWAQYDVVGPEEDRALVPDNRVRGRSATVDPTDSLKVARNTTSAKQEKVTSMTTSPTASLPTTPKRRRTMPK